MSWDTELRTVLKDYLEHESTITVVVAMYRGIRATPRLYAGVPSEEDASEGGQALLEHVFILPNSPFMGMFGSQMTAVYQAAANAHTDSFAYFAEEADLTPETRAENLMRITGCQRLVHEVAMTAVLCERGFGFYRQKSLELRGRLYDLKDII